MDIRRFFGGTSTTKLKEKVDDVKKKPSANENSQQKKKKSSITDDDDDLLRPKAKKKRRRIVLFESDSDEEEDPLPLKFRKPFETKKPASHSGDEIKKKSTKATSDNKKRERQPDFDKSKKKANENILADPKKEAIFDSDTDDEDPLPKKLRKSEKSKKITTDYVSKEKPNKHTSINQKEESNSDKDTKKKPTKNTSAKRKKEHISDSDEDSKKKSKKIISSNRKNESSTESNSDDDTKRKLAKKHSARRKKAPAYDSDEESSKKSIKSLFANQSLMQSKSSSLPAKKKNEVSSPKLVPTTISDFFGSSPVERSARNTVAVKRKNTPDNAKLANAVDNDGDFEATLQQLDEENIHRKSGLDERIQKAKAEIKAASPKRETVKTKSPPISPVTSEANITLSHKVSPVKENGAKESSSSLATKLASKVRAEKDKGTMESDSTFKKVKEEKKSPTSSPDVKKTVKSISPSKRKSETIVEESPNIIEGTPTTENEKKSKSKKEDLKTKYSKSNIKSETEDSKPAETTLPTDKLKKRLSYLTYQNFLQREGPQALGTKEIPEGAENCMEGMTFVITGVLDSLERDQAKELVERYGGKVTQSVSKNTTYLVAGRDAGPAKIEKAIALHTKQIDEDGLLELVRTLPGKKSKYDVSNQVLKKSPSIVQKSDHADKTQTPEISSKTLKVEEEFSPTSSSHSSPQISAMSDCSLLWVDKYKPQNLKQIIGQQGDKSCANKLLHWLKCWQKNRSKETSTKKTGFFNKLEDGSNFKAALLSGPPGIGKTTTATLVCKELDFSYIELNASDTRSKKSLQHEVSEALSSHTLSGVFAGTSGSSSLKTTKHTLLMDEVDGMAGNEDRGGIQEVIALIKSTKIPIICMCNDRSHPKIRSLVNYCFDLRFQRPRVEQIKGPIMSIAFKEGLKLPPPALQEIIVASNHDIRQVLHNLSVWSAKEKALTFDQAKANAKMAKKDIKLGPFDVGRKVFAGGEETAHMTINDKSDLFFHDYSIAPLFVQENYIIVQPYAARGDPKKHMELLSKAADSICDGDLVDKLIRNNQTWNLLPTEAIFSSVIPGDVMRGSFTQMVNFPSWFGRNSRQGKFNRILQELHLHSRLRVSGNKLDLNLDYLPNFKKVLTSPLIKHETEGITSVLDVMRDYSFLREDLDGLLEVALWPGQKDPMASINPKVKAAFTRAFNKEGFMTPFSTTTVKKGRRGAASQDDEDAYVSGEFEEGVTPIADEVSDNEDLEKDAMIKSKKKPPAKKTKEKASSESSSKGKGKGRGKSTKSGR